jgi:hypothetical protein
MEVFMTYFLRHPASGYTGQFGPVGFSNGIGSTGNKEDRDFVIGMGCSDVTEEYQAIAAAAPVSTLGLVEYSVYKVIVTYKTFSANAYTADKVIATLPAGTKLAAIYADTTIPYTGGAVSAATLCIGKTVGGEEYLPAHDVFSAAVVNGSSFSGDIPSWTAPTDVSVRMTTTTGKANVLTAGSTTFYLICEKFKEV